MRKRIVLFWLTMLLSSIALWAQKPVIVTEQTVQIKKHDTLDFYAGFAASDIIGIDVQELHGKKITSVEVVEYPAITKFSEYKQTRIRKKITVSKNAVYLFRIINDASTTRTVKLKVERNIGSEAPADFNTNVVWIDPEASAQDNKIVGYDTVYTPERKLVKVRTERSEEMICNKTERVHSHYSIGNKNRQTIGLSLPKDEIGKYSKKRMIAWAYWIGVGEEASKAWAKNVSTIGHLAAGVADIAGGGPLAGLAIGAITELVKPTMGEDVAYWIFVDADNARKFLNKKSFASIDKGKGVAAYGKNINRDNRTLYIGLLNDNSVQAIDVNVKVSVIWETEVYEEKLVQTMSLQPRYAKPKNSNKKIPSLYINE